MRRYSVARYRRRACSNDKRDRWMAAGGPDMRQRAAVRSGRVVC